MSIILVGLNHRTAPVDLRERFSLTNDGLHIALKELHTDCQSCPPGTDQAQTVGSISVPAGVQEVVILSTCNRLEVYAVAEDALSGWRAIESFLARHHSISMDILCSHLYALEGRAAIEHLMQVTTGLDSMVLGESQILGQVAQAFSTAQAANTVGAILSHLFTEAIHIGKRARSETSVSRHTTSVSHAAALLMQTKIGDLRCARVLVVGAGEMAQLAARALQIHGVQDIAYINRTDARAETLARHLQGIAHPWCKLPDALAWADGVITTTNAPHTIIGKDDLREILPRRTNRPLVFVDIAVPRDVEPSVGNLPGVHHFDIDDLQNVLDTNLAQRQAAVPEVAAIVNEGVETFLAWLHGRQVVPTIVGFRRKAEAVANGEVAQVLRRLDTLDQHSQQIIACLAHRIVNKLLHKPTERLKAHAANGTGHIYAQAIQDLFDLDISDATAGQASIAIPNREEYYHD